MQDSNNQSISIENLMEDNNNNNNGNNPKKDPFYNISVINEEEKGAYFEEIVEFLRPFVKEVMEVKADEKGMDKVISLIKEHFSKNEEKKKQLMKLINVNRLIIPIISLDLPSEIILAYNKMEEDDPLFPVFRLHPLIGEEIFKFGIFLDRFDTNKEVICSLVWSCIDNLVICLPQIGLNPYPICWHCEQNFGTFTCSKCGVAKYCCKEHQVEGWKQHKSKCNEIEKFSKDHAYLQFQ